MTNHETFNSDTQEESFENFIVPYSERQRLEEAWKEKVAKGIGISAAAYEVNVVEKEE